MNILNKIIITLIGIILGVTLALSSKVERANAVPLTCCTYCLGYCYCEDVTDPNTTGCESLPCADNPQGAEGDCWGNGFKCCLPTVG